MFGTESEVEAAIEMTVTQGLAMTDLHMSALDLTAVAQSVTVIPHHLMVCLT